MSKNKDVEKAVTQVLSGCATPFITVWALMLAVGALHRSVDARVPAFGYWACFLILFVLGILRNAGRQPK